MSGGSITSFGAGCWKGSTTFPGRFWGMAMALEGISAVVVAEICGYRVSVVDCG